MLALGIAGLATADQTGMTRLLPYLLLTASIASQILVRTQSTISTPHMPPSLDISDGGRLNRAFSWTAAGLCREFREDAGARATRKLMEDFNNYALAAGWRVSIVDGRPHDSLSNDLGLVERGRVYGAALTLLLDLSIAEAGETSTVRAFQRVYDGLCWQEREIGDQYLFPDVEQASALSQAFQHATQGHRALLRRMPLFAGMNDREIEQLLPLLREEHYGAGKIIVWQGEPGDRFFIVERGHVLVTATNEAGVSEVVNRLDRGDFFGEMALLHDAPRNATCRASMPTDLLSLSRDDFDRLVRDRFTLRQKLEHSVALLDLLCSVPLFAEMDAQQIALLSAQLQENQFQSGDVIMRQDEIGDTFHIVQSGRVRASVSEDDKETVVAERGPGEYVGEIALLLDTPRTATITALEPTSTYSLGKADFDRLLARYLFVSRGLELDASRRLSDLTRASTAA
jgi:CRP-like cAMP-binding protein